MIIKHASVADIPRLTALWQEAFGDSVAFISGFFRTGFAPERAAVAGDAMGALYWFDCLWKGKKIAYVYAVATAKVHRGKGVCRALMDWTHGVLRAHGYAGAILVPADEGLARMYGKMGYRAIGCHPERAKQVEGFPSPMGIATTGVRTGLAMTEKLEKISAEEYLERRRALLPENAVAHTEIAFSYMATFLQFYRFPGGICCGNESGWEEVLPDGAGEKAMYLPLDSDTELPGYFALGMG